MAIAIVSDLVLDVVKAANPDRSRIAQAGLQTGKASQQFAAAVDSVHKTSGIGRFLSTDIVGDVAGAGKIDPKAKAYQKFEASVLRNFVEDMLPKSTESIYGAGTAGNVWRSMQADFMSQELAKSGGIGIASTLARLDRSKEPGAALNEIAPHAPKARNSLTNTTDWPYFSRSDIGVLES
jgi:peptidoglycan hydrolase FlgJ